MQSRNDSRLGGNTGMNTTAAFATKPERSVEIHTLNRYGP